MGHLGCLLVIISPLISLYIFGVAGHFQSGCHKQQEFRCSDGLCISREKVCDGRMDCSDASDEDRCGHVRCKSDQFTCHSRRCISAQLLCNGVNDCGDGSDEISCQSCPSGFFSCGPSDACLPRDKLCDGQVNCENKRDESWELCGSEQPLSPSAPACAASEFQCGDGACIRQTWRCDHTADCFDGSDEENCNQDECQINNGGCSHHCVDLPMGFLCQCPNNMTLVDDSQCEEVDVCLASDVCDQLCVHVNESNRCDCHKGYRMISATGECKAEGDEARLVFTTSGGVRLMKLPGSEHQPVSARFPGSGPITVAASSGTIFWARRGQRSIHSISADSKSQKAVLERKVHGSVSSLAVDWIHQLLYWTCPERGAVNVGPIGGSWELQVVTGLELPSAVAVDPLQGFIFWTQGGNSPKIERANLDGERRKPVVTLSLGLPVAITLDLPRQLLYWFDQEARSISRVNYHGRHRKTVIESNGYLDRLFGLSLFEGFLYWGDEATRSICRANKHNGNNLQVLLSDVPSVGGVSIFQQALQPNGPSTCGHTGMVCQHTCAVDLQGERLQFSCLSEKMENDKSQSPEVSRAVPASPFSGLPLAGILSLIMLLCVLLLGTVLWAWRRELRPPSSLTAQRSSLKESQDPLLNHVCVQTFLIEHDGD